RTSSSSSSFRQRPGRRHRPAARTASPRHSARRRGHAAGQRTGRTGRGGRERDTPRRSVSEPSAPLTEEGPTEPGPRRHVGREIGRAALLIGAITAAARVVGFARQLVFAHTVGSHCLGTAYATANQVPNIIFDIVVGGALTSAVVPVLAGAAARRGNPASKAAADAEASQIASGLITWTLLLLVPASVIIAVLAGPLASLLLAGSPRCPHASTV